VELAQHILGRVRQLLHEHSGFELPDWVVSARVGERIEALGIGEPQRYLELLAAPAGRRELGLLVEALRVGETSFFRHRAQMDAIARTIVPSLAKLGRRRVRVWSAGCASGEEPYSLAMLMRRALPRSVELSILASDISEDALAKARVATYSTSALSQVPVALREWAFVPEAEGRYRIKDELGGLVRFEQRNLADGSFPCGFDLILCRNVLIYFSAPARTRVIDGLIASLNREGYLLVGYAESLRSFSKLEPQQTPDAVIYKRAADKHDVASPPAVASAAPTSAPVNRALPRDAHPTTAVVELRGRYEDGDQRLAQELSRALSGHYAQVVIDVDGADFLSDDAGRVLRRAVSVASSSKVDVRIVAQRPGPQRWLRRLGLSTEASR